MLDTPRGSHAAHLIVSRYDGGPRAGHDLDGWHTNSRWPAVLLAAFLAAVFIGLAQGPVRHGFIDTHKVHHVGP